MNNKINFDNYSAEDIVEIINDIASRRMVDTPISIDSPTPESILSYVVQNGHLEFSKYVEVTVLIQNQNGPYE